MSMLSSMCDELRKTADKVDEFGKTLWRGRDVLTDATRELRDAADTIWELRNDCVELRVENAKLREMVRDMRKALFTLDIDHCQACPRDTINGPCTKYLVGGSDECSFEEDMRELRIEVVDETL